MSAPAPLAEFEQFLTAREVAERLRIAPCTVLRYFEEGVLPGRRLRIGRGRPVRFRWSEIEAVLIPEGPKRAGLMRSPRGRARTGEIKRTAGGWAIRWRDARGIRRQRGGFRTKGEAKDVLDDELRKARLGPLYRPDVTLQQLVDAFLEQYQGAPASKSWLRYYLIKATDRLRRRADRRAARAGHRALALEDA